MFKKITITTILYSFLLISEAKASLLSEYGDSTTTETVSGLIAKIRELDGRRYHLTVTKSDIIFLMIREDIMNDIDYFPRDNYKFSKYFLKYQALYFKIISDTINNPELLNKIKYFLLDTHEMERERLNQLNEIVSMSNDKAKIKILNSVIKDMQEIINNRNISREKSEKGLIANIKRMVRGV
ncbi:hypothetical protein AB832_06605 [Flavobacteriaceae bacterium (ex Bugula neritina AB1)]|nr:hypothetical protein AB832_06605 [Flavobacteriaceae bacterium (ex Bugula neritina AB1)]